MILCEQATVVNVNNHNEGNKYYKEEYQYILEINKVNNPFMKHPDAVGETYIEHMGNALKFSFTFLQLAVIAYIHAFFPFLFTNTGSDKVKELNNLMLKRREQEYH